jgi:hypothetical protein
MRVEGTGRVEGKNDKAGAARLAGVVSMLVGCVVLAFALLGAPSAGATTSNPRWSSPTTTPCDTTTTVSYWSTTTTLPAGPGIVTTSTGAPPTSAPTSTTAAPTSTTAPIVTAPVVTGSVQSSTTTTDTVPVSAGQHPSSSTTITVKGTSVTAPPVGPGPTLPFTGSAAFPLVVVALGLIGAGLGLLVRNRRRVAG